MCNPSKQNISLISCPSCSAEMIKSKVNEKSRRVEVKHFPKMRNVLKTSTFDYAEEVELHGLAFSRGIRRRYGDGRLFVSNCSGLCLACHNPLTVYRVVHTSGPVPAEHSAVDFQHGYRSAEIYDTDQSDFAGGHLLEDVLHHGSYYGSWLECWSQAFPYATVSESELGDLVNRSLDAADAIAKEHQEVSKLYKFEAKII